MAKKILIVTDAYTPQVNGVVTTLVNVEKQLVRNGHDVKILGVDDCARSFKMPFYNEISLGIVRTKNIRAAVEWSDAVHISTPEGPVGFRVLRYCVRNNIPFTSGYHSKWPEFIRARLPIPVWMTYSYMKWLHKHSKAILVPTQSAQVDLMKEKFTRLVVWTRGVDRTQFIPRLSSVSRDKPVLLCVSRISHEKGLDDFCKLQGDYIKVVVGDGPYLDTLKRKYPAVIFTGMLHGDELAQRYADADVFVFPSKTDTFGVVMIEAMACGTPVAAYPVTGPIDVIEPGFTGSINDNLQQAVARSLTIDRTTVCKHSDHWSWETCAKQFYDSLHFRNCLN